MSAYMVDDGVINQVVACFTHDSDIASFLTHCKGFDLSTEQGAKSFATRIFVLNKMGVEARYGKGQAKEVRPLDFEFMRVMPKGKMTGLKALGTVMYQCSEGNYENSRFYALLEDLKLWLAMDLVRAMPSYEIAPGS